MLWATLELSPRHFLSGSRPSHGGTTLTRLFPSSSRSSSSPVRFHCAKLQAKSCCRQSLRAWTSTRSKKISNNSPAFSALTTCMSGSSVVRSSWPVCMFRSCAKSTAPDQRAICTWPDRFENVSICMASTALLYSQSSVRRRKMAVHRRSPAPQLRIIPLKAARSRGPVGEIAKPVVFRLVC